MQIPLQVTFRGMSLSSAAESSIRQKAQKLERFHGRITGCRVTIEAPHRHHHKGKLYSVRIDLTGPGYELLASKGNGKNHAHEDLYVALRDAFDAVARQLEDTVRRMRGEVKTHEAPARRRVAKPARSKREGVAS